MKLMVKGKIFTRKKLAQGSLLIEDGRITRVAKDIHKPVDEVLDYSREKNYIILPGFIDIHVHLRDFELAYKEDFYTGTSAAAMGGFTVVADMPNTKPEVNEPQLLKKRDRVAKSKAVVDYGLYYGVPKEASHLTKEIEALALGFKVFMHHEFYTNERQLVESVLEHAARKRSLVVVHAENPKFFVKTPIGMVGTPKAEASAIKDIATQASRHGFPLHVTHLSSADGVRELLKWKKRIKLTTDTCPHYLLLSDEDAKSQGPIAKVEPPLKSGADAEFLLKRLKNGGIDAVSSDHAPHSLEEKADRESALAGFPGLETTVPLLLTIVNRGLLTLGDVIRVCATNPSKILGLNTAGEIEEGKVGNLTIVDLHRKGKIEPTAFVSKAKYSPFEGREVKGMAVGTIVRGKSVMLDGEIVATKGWGANVKTYG